MVKWKLIVVVLRFLMKKLQRRKLENVSKLENLLGSMSGWFCSWESHWSCQMITGTFVGGQIVGSCFMKGGPWNQRHSGLYSFSSLVPSSAGFKTPGIWLQSDGEDVSRISATLFIKYFFVFLWSCKRLVVSLRCLTWISFYRLLHLAVAFWKGLPEIQWQLLPVPFIVRFAVQFGQLLLFPWENCLNKLNPHSVFLHMLRHKLMLEKRRKRYVE